MSRLLPPFARKKMSSALRIVCTGLHFVPNSNDVVTCAAIPQTGDP